VGAVTVLIASLIASKFLLDALVEFDWPIVVYVVILGLVGYGPSVAWWLVASKRWGTGQPIRDVGATPRWSDLGWGPLIWLAAIGTQVVIAIAVIGFDIPISNNTDGISELQADRSYVVAIVITAVIAAPLVEEIVFRGLMMRSLLGRFGPVVAVGIQGVLFGLAHVDPVRGAGNIGLALVLSGVGCALGGFAYMLRRIGPAIVAHAIFNGVAMILVLTGVADRVREENPDPFGSVVGEQIAVVDEAYVVEPHGGGDAS
jgi:membrane protease YdiL (CAAX protease family)